MRVPARLLEGCLGWVAVAAGLELLSIVGFVLVFTLAFRGAGLAGAGAGPRAGLRSLAAATLLPAGGLVGPVAGALGPDTDTAAIRRLTRSSIGLVVLTSVPLFVAVVVIGVMLGMGWLNGPHNALLTLLPAAIAFAAVAVAWRVSQRRPVGETTVALVQGGLADARDLALGGDWRLVGSLAYYGFDTAVLWAAFHALAQTPRSARSSWDTCSDRSPRRCRRRRGSELWRADSSAGLCSTARRPGPPPRRCCSTGRSQCRSRCSSAGLPGPRSWRSPGAAV